MLSCRTRMSKASRSIGDLGAKKKNMKSFVLLVSGILLLCIGCVEGTTPMDDNEITYCEILKSNLVIVNEPIVKDVVDQMLSILPPSPTVDDPVGHSQNLITFIDRLKNECHFDARNICYACIETFPLTSEVAVFLDSSGVEVRRVFDLRTPGTEAMTLTDIHE